MKESINNKNKQRRKIIDIENATMQEKIMLALAFMLVLIFITFLLKNFSNKDNNIDYNEINGELLYSSAIYTNDREVYWILSDIFETFLNSYKLEQSFISKLEKDTILYSREDFYLTLLSEYKKEISKKEYMEISKNMLDKFISNYNFKTENFIEEIRSLNSNEYSSNMYICKLNTYDNSNSYIGIKLYPNTNGYNIFYLE